MFRVCNKSTFLRAILVMSTETIKRTKFFQFRNVRATSSLYYASSSVDITEGYDSDREADLNMDIEIAKDDANYLPRLNLYPNSEDPLVSELSSATTLQQVFDLLGRNKNILNELHSSQAIVTLWDLQKMMYRIGASYGPEIHVQDYIQEVTSHKAFRFLLTKVKEDYRKMTDDALICTILYLSKMGIDIKGAEMQELVNFSVERLQNFPLTAVSRFTVACKNKGLWGALMLSPAMPVMSSHLQKCDNDSDLRLITICMNNANVLVTTRLAKMYLEKVEELWKKGELNDAVTLSKVISFFCGRNHWVQRLDAQRLIQQLGLRLKGQVHRLDLFDILVLHKVLEMQMEPADLMDSLQQHAARMIEEEKDKLPRADLLYCVVSNTASVSQKKKLAAVFQSYLEDSDHFALHWPQLLKLVRCMKINKKDLYDQFWDRVIAVLKNSSSSLRLSAVHHYLHFLGGVSSPYRNLSFETNMKKWLLKELDSGIINPSKFFRTAAFLVACCPEGVPEFVMEKMQMLDSQLSINDSQVLSKGIQVALFLQRQKGVSTGKLLDQITRLVQILNDCSLQHITQAESVVNFTTIAKAYLNRRGTPNTLLYETLNTGLTRSVKESQLCSRSILDLAFIFSSTGYLLPSVMDRLVSHVVENSNFLMGETVQRFLNLCYILGYVPKQKEFFSLCREVIERNHEKLPCLNVLQAALSLCFFQHANSNLLQSIFNVEFLDRIEEELGLHPRLTYSTRVRHLLMELNRCVCIEYHESDIPWFHEKYCQEMASKAHVHGSAFQAEVGETLRSVAGSDKCIRANVYSSYYHYIDFEILMDQHGNPMPNVHSGSVNALIPTPDREKLPRSHQKTAILLLHDDAYCANTLHLKGPYQMKQRHLEVLGYKVIPVSRHLWNAMYMAEPGAKERYVEQRLFKRASN